MRPDKVLTYSFIFVLSFRLSAQKDAKHVYEGNKLYNSGMTVESTDRYRKALKENPNNAKAHFNLGNSLYKNGFEVRNSKENFIQGGKKVTPDSMAALVFDEAAKSYEYVTSTISDKDTLHRAWHNVGNCYLQKKDYTQAVEAYKKALRLDPKDEETRYNLAYALRHIPPKQNQGGGGQSNRDKESKDKKEQKSEMNKDQAEQMLKAIMQAEKKLQDKRKQKQEDASKTTVNKDW